jgi:hypothetical protein
LPTDECRQDLLVKDVDTAVRSGKLAARAHSASIGAWPFVMATFSVYLRKDARPQTSADLAIHQSSSLVPSPEKRLVNCNNGR